METPEFEFKFPEQLQNIILNKYFASMAENKVDQLITEATLKIYNRYGISTEKAMKLLQEQAIALAEIRNLYGGGETDG